MNVIQIHLQRWMEPTVFSGKQPVKVGALGKTLILSFVLGFSSLLIFELTELLQSEDSGLYRD